MKKIIAKVLVVLMLMTSVAIPADGETPAEAASKAPMMDVSGGIENFKMLIKEGMVQEVGKSVTLTLKNVKKSNLKSITYYILDPRVATLTEKKITQKRIGCKVKIKKLGRTVLSVRYTLKKKQNGSKYWWGEFDITGVKKMSKKELTAFPKKFCEANKHSALLNKHDNYVLHAKGFDESGKEITLVDDYQCKEDMYVRHETNDGKEIMNTYLKTNTGYQILRGDKPFAGYYIYTKDPAEDPNVNVPFPDDPESAQKMIEVQDPELLYYDGSRYYYSDVSNSKAKVWNRSETVCDGKTCELITMDTYFKNDKGKEYLYNKYRMETDIEMPDMYDTLKYHYTAGAKKKVKVECIIDPGLTEERRVSCDVPEGAPLKIGLFQGYDRFLDAEGKTPLPDDYDTYSDLTVYLIKSKDSSSAQFSYVHNPMDNPKVAADIIPDSKAVYGYVPNPESKRLGAFASYDWSDPVVVAEMRKQREDYHKSVEELEQMIVSMKKEGKTIEEIAKAVSTRRNEIRLESYKDDPEGLKKVKESNLATYGNENGPTLEWLIDKYKTWDVVLEKAMSMNAAADAVLGLYDKYYDTYIA